MPAEGQVHLNLPLKNADCKVQINLTNTDCVGQKCKSESHDKSNHGIFCVTGKGLDYIDIDDLY